jgi:hypothetical protein
MRDAAAVHALLGFDSWPKKQDTKDGALPTSFKDKVRAAFVAEVSRPYSSLVTWISVATVLPSYYALGAECATNNTDF